MAKVNFPLYMSKELHGRFKKMWENKYNRHSFYSMFIDIALPVLEKYEKESKKNDD